MRTRNVVLTEQQAVMIDRLLSCGRYQNASEVLRDGLRLVQQREADVKPESPHSGRRPVLGWPIWPMAVTGATLMGGAPGIDAFARCFVSGLSADAHCPGAGLGRRVVAI